MRRQGRSGEPRSALTRLIGGGVAAALVLCLGTLQSSTADDDLGYPPHPRFPGQGLPDIPGGGMYVPPQATALSDVARAKQWIRTPSLQAAVFNRGTTELDDRQCRGLIQQVPGAQTWRRWSAAATLVNRAASVDGANRFGESEPFRVRAVAFGSIPVAATVALVQSRSGNGTVVPAEVSQETGSWCPGEGPFQTRPGPDYPFNSTYRRNAEFNGELAVRVDALQIDGVAVRLAAGCRADGAVLRLGSPDWDTWDPSIPREEMPEFGEANLPQDERIERLMAVRYYNVANGGVLEGEMTVPAFSGCRTSAGEDLARLLTATISGPGNRVELRTEGLAGTGVGDPFTQCPFSSNCAPAWPGLPMPN